MKKLTVLLVLLSQISLLFSQNFEISWQQCYGGSEVDKACDIIEVQDGYLIVGNTRSDDGDISFNHGTTEIWLIKTDTNGNLIWEKTFGGSKGEGCRRIIPDSNGNYYLLGASDSSDGDVTYDPYTDSWDFWILKIDSIGEIIWDKIVGGNADETMWTGTLTDDGGIVAIGWSASDDGDVSIHYGLYDTWMVKLNSEGEVEWDFTVGTDWQDYGQALIQTSDGGYLVGSSSAIRNGGNISCEPHSSWADCVLVKLDADRNIEWQQCYGGSEHDGILGILEIEDGYIFSAYAGSNDGDISGWHGEDDVWVVKIDIIGNIIWQKCLGGTRYEHARNLFQLEDESLILVGCTESQNGDVSGNHSSSEYDKDVWFIKLSSEGELLSQQCFGGIGSETFEFGVIKKSDNNFVIAGQTDWGSSYDVECTPHGQTPPSMDTDYWVFEIKDCTQYAAATPEKATGPDTICSTNNAGNIYTTATATNAWAYQWMIAPETAGTITGDSLQGTVSWSPDYEGTATIIVRSANDCGESEWSQPHYTQVYTCLGVNELQTDAFTLKVYPNPATNYVIFELPVISNPLVVISRETTVGSDEKSPKNNPQNPPQITITNTLGQQVAQIEVKDSKTVWDARGIKPGVYFYFLQMEGKRYSGKVVVQK